MPRPYGTGFRIDTQREASPVLALLSLGLFIALIYAICAILGT